MSKQNWKPGDVGTFGGLPALRTLRGWTHYDGSVGSTGQDGNRLLRPLVVIDPEDEETFREPLQAWTLEAFGYTATPQDLNRFAAALREFADPKPPKCVAHGHAECADCSRITAQYLNPNGECSGCGTYGSDGMHWDTCPGRIKGTLYATREDAVAL